MRAMFLVAFFALSAGQATYADEMKDVEGLFGKYQRLWQAFDVAVLDMYCDSAVITNVRWYPDGMKRVLELSSSQYRELVQIAMPAAKMRGDYSTFSGVAYAHEERGVRIVATRYSVMNDYNSPFSMLWGTCGDGKLKILEETSNSRR